MQMNEVEFPSAPVEGYGPGFFRIGGQVIEGAILVLPTGVSAWSGDLTELTGADVDVILYGTGAEIAFPPREVKAAMEEAGVGLEAMSSPSACRTYNVLLSEGRRIGLVALPV